MVVRVEDRVAAVASPAHAASLVSAAALEGHRYVFFAVDALLVVLSEHATGTPPLNPRAEARRCSQFGLWQVWDTRERVLCVRANTTGKRVARGAVALCLEDGRVALLVPTSAAAHVATAAPPALARTASKLTIKTGDADAPKPVSTATRRASLFAGGARAGHDVTRDYVKLHLHLQLPTWQESIRWRADDDRAMDRVEWVESGDDLWLVGAGDKITTWKLVEESGVVAYQQLSFAVGEPDTRAWHMDVTASGRFVTTAGHHDRVLKLWSLQELGHDGTPVCLFLAHRRALVSACWAKQHHTFKLHGAAQCEMLYTLDRAGTVSIWRENMASPSRAFTLWKTLTSEDIAMRMPPLGDGDSSVEYSPIKSWGLVVNNWSREAPRTTTAFTDALLEEANVMAALSQFHYGYTSLDEVRRNELLNQRMDNVPKTNSKLLGGRTGAAADTHAGETFVCGNMPLSKTFLVHLGYGIHANGDFSLFRFESIPFSGVSPKSSLLCCFSGLKEQLGGATVYNASSADYKDRENGSASFFLELLFQPHGIETQLKVARLKFQVESGGFRSSRANVSYSVQMCEVGDASPSLMSANVSDPPSTATLNLSTLSPVASSASGHGHLAVFNQGGHVDILRTGSHVGPIKVVCRSRDLFASPSTKPTHTALWLNQKILFAFDDSRLHASYVGCEPSPGMVGTPTTAGMQSHSLVAPKMLFSDDEEDAEGLQHLIVCGVSASQKKAWSAAPTSFFFAAQPTEVPVTLKDFCVVIGLRQDRQSLIVWVFSVEPLASASEGEVAVVPVSAPPLKLFRRLCVNIPESHRVLRVAATPSLDDFETLFVTVCEKSFTLSLWGFSDMDDMSALVRVHSTDLTLMLKAPTPSTDMSTVNHDMMQFSFSESEFEFCDITVSACGRAALLFEESARSESTNSGYVGGGNAKAGGDFSVCIVSLFDKWHESVVKLPRQKYGQILSIKWTQPLAPSLDCQVVFLSATAIGLLKVDDSSGDGAWTVSWSSQRLSSRPRLISDMGAYPQALVSLGTGIANINLADLAGAGLLTTSPSAGIPICATLPTTDIATNVAHPITLLFLLMRGSFASLDRALRHIKTSIVDHEKTCYLKMLEDQELRKLPFMKLGDLLGTGDVKEERSVTFTKGKSGSSGSNDSRSSSTMTSRPSLARASDLFAMDFGSVRRSSLALGLGGGENMFGSSSSVSSSVETPEVPALELEGSEMSVFFSEHASSLTFLEEELRSVFLDVISGSKRIVAWEKDTSRAKDEPTIRFAASLLWPYKATPPSETKTTTEGAEALVENEETSAQTFAPVGGICSEQVAWAAISDYQNELLQECFPSPAFTLQDLYQLRLPFWLKSYAKLMQFTEKAAQAEYASTRDPFRVSLFYVLLGKSKLLTSLFKMGGEPKIADLVANDFSDPRWKNAAVKNAYVLKAKRRHELSATFFLLGGKVQEAMSVAEHADPTLVLSFLIARLTEKWDLGGGDGQNDGLSGGLGDVSFTGLSSNMRNLDAIRASADSGAVDSFKDVCKDYLKTAVWTKALACGDVFMMFIVKYLTGEMGSALQALQTVPNGDVTCMFEPKLSNDPRRGLYWRVFGQSLLGATDLVRFVQPTLPRMTSVMKVQAVQLQAIALNRLFALGCNVAALYQQRDMATQFKQFCKENLPRSSAVRAAFLAARHRILASVISGQCAVLSEGIISTLDRLLTGNPAAESISSSFSDILEDRLDEEIQCLVTGSGKFEFADLPETQNAAIEGALRHTVLDTMRQTGQQSLEEFVYSHWFPPQQPPKITGSPLQLLLETAVDGIAVVAAGDLAASATRSFHSKHVDQTCSELLTLAEKLLHWLAYFFHGKRPASQTVSSSIPSGSSDFIRVVTASVYSILCLCCRYVKAPCCVHRSLSAVFPHIDSLPKKFVDDIKEIALADVCVYCTAVKSVEPEAPTGLPSLQRDIPVLYQIVQMLHQNLNTVVEEVRTNRLELAPPMLFYSYCQYWALVLSIATSTMPSHITKVAVDGANPHALGTLLAKKLVQSWSVYASNLTKYSSRILLCEITESYFRPFNMRAPSTPTGTAPSTPKDGSGATYAAASSPNTPTATSSATQVMSPLGRDRRESRQLLRCTCDRCPWLLILKMFADKDELLLRINSQLECCGEKIKEEISWGHLPDFPSKKTALTRSQKILLSNAAAGKGVELSDLLEKRNLQGASTIQLDAHCIYRSDVSIKSLCFNQATETAELVLCSSKGICRTASVEYSDGTKYQFKGMYAPPQASFTSESTGPTTRRKTVDAASMLRTDNSPRTGADAGTTPADTKTPSFKPTAVEQHPFLPLFVSGNQKGKVHLWSYESLSSICEFQTKDIVTTYALGQSTSSRRDIKKIRFDNLGQQIGAVDSLGRLAMWKFGNLDREPCYRLLDCHDKGAKSLHFINSSTIVATVGSSSNKRSVCMWDLLLPNSKAQIAAPSCHPAGAASLTFSPTHQLLISGGEGGSISVFDVRQRRVLHTITNAHETAITTLELHPSGRCVLSGSASGDVKIWSLPIFRELVAVSKVHAKPSFLGDAASNLLGDAASNMAINVTNSSWGVTDAFATDDFFFTSGTDGSVQRFRVPSLSKLF